VQRRQRILLKLRNVEQTYRADCVSCRMQIAGDLIDFQL